MAKIERNGSERGTLHDKPIVTSWALWKCTWEGIFFFNNYLNFRNQKVLCTARL